MKPHLIFACSVLPLHTHFMYIAGLSPKSPKPHLGPKVQTYFGALATVAHLHQRTHLILLIKWRPRRVGDLSSQYNDQTLRYLLSASDNVTKSNNEGELKKMHKEIKNKIKYLYKVKP